MEDRLNKDGLGVETCKDISELVNRIFKEIGWGWNSVKDRITPGSIYFSKK